MADFKQQIDDALDILKFDGSEYIKHLKKD